MLYSIYPVDLVMDEEEEPSFMQLEISGQKVLLRQSGPYSLQVERIISTNPDDYMGGLHPGLTVDLFEGL